MESWGELVPGHRIDKGTFSVLQVVYSAGGIRTDETIVNPNWATKALTEVQDALGNSQHNGPKAVLHIATPSSMPLYIHLSVPFWE